MNKWLQRWQGMAPRERWLAYGVGLGLLFVLYVLLIGDPLQQVPVVGYHDQCAGP